MFYKKKLIILLIALVLASIAGLVHHILNKEDALQVYYSKTDNLYFFLIKDNEENMVYDIIPYINKKSRSKDIKHYIDSVDYVRTHYNPLVLEKEVSSEFILSVSEKYPHINFSHDRKMTYDIQINSEGLVKANVHYPENKIGGYTFMLEEKDLDLLQKIVGSPSVLSPAQDKFVNDYYRIAAISINGKLINNEIFSDIHLCSVLMFTNYIGLKYIGKLTPNTETYNIITSKYTEIAPPPLSIVN